MALEDSKESGPQLRYARHDDVPTDDLVKALELARLIEELLDEPRSVAGVVAEPRGASSASVHSTRIARAMAASLVDELLVLVRPARKTGLA